MYNKYTYDNYGNIVKITEGGELCNSQNRSEHEVSYSNGRLSRINNVGFNRPVLYDYYGNISSYNGYKYKYNDRNQLSKVEKPDNISVEYEYNYLGKGMAIAGGILSWSSSAYNNFTNQNYTLGEAFVASVMDAGYYGVKGYLSYKAGAAIGGLAINAGMAAGTTAVGLAAAIGLGFTGSLIIGLAVGGIVAIGIGVAGAYAIYYIGGLIDDGWEWLKKQIFE